MMSFLVTLPRRLYLYLREVVYGEGHTWITVAEDESDEDSGWSTSEEDSGNSLRQTHRTKTKADKKTGKKSKGSKKDPPPIAPKPKNPSTSISNASLTPPPSPTNSEEKMLQQSTFDEISGQKPLTSYRRVRGPNGRRKPVRYSYLTMSDAQEDLAM